MVGLLQKSSLYLCCLGCMMLGLLQESFSVEVATDRSWLSGISLPSLDQCECTHAPVGRRPADGAAPAEALGSGCNVAASAVAFAAPSSP